MKPKSAAGVVIRVKDIAKSVDFYETIGLNFKRKQANRATGYLNWFWIELLPASKEAELGSSNTALYFSVDDLDEVLQYCQENKLNIDGEITDTALGNTELSVIDPDGNSVVFFKRK